jgi:hypothetical protein
MKRQSQEAMKGERVYKRHGTPCQENVDRKEKNRGRCKSRHRRGRLKQPVTKRNTIQQNPGGTTKDQRLRCPSYHCRTGQLRPDRRPCTYCS